jgi:hypothetical protein
MDVEYQYLGVRHYKLDVDYHPLVVRWLSLDVNYHYVDVNIQCPLPDVPYISTMSYYVAEPFIYAKPYCANHMIGNPYGPFVAYTVVSELAPLLMNLSSSLQITLEMPNQITDCHPGF